MAKELYIPVNGFSKKTSKFYAPVNGFSKEIVKAYCSVNGFSKLFYEKGGSAGWSIYEVSDIKCIDIVSYGTTYSYSKVNVGIAYYAAFKTGSVVNPLFISTDADAVTIHTTVGDRTTTYNGTITYNGDTWYYNTRWGVTVDETLPIESLVTPSECLLPNEYSSIQDAVEYFLANYIYSNDFAEDYQVGRYYDFALGDIEKTIRKEIGIWLFKNYTIKGNTDYNTLLESIETLVSNVLDRCSRGNYTKIVIQIVQGTQASDLAKWIRIETYLSNLDIYPTAIPRVTSRTTNNGYDSLEIDSNIRCQYNITHRFDNNGMSIQTDGTVSPYFMTKRLGHYMYSQNNYLSLASSSIGLNL